MADPAKTADPPVAEKTPDVAPRTPDDPNFITGSDGVQHRRAVPFDPAKEKPHPSKTQPAAPLKLYHVTYQGSVTLIEAEDESHARRKRTGDGDGPPPSEVQVVEILRKDAPLADSVADLPKFHLKYGTVEGDINAVDEKAARALFTTQNSIPPTVAGTCVAVPKPVAAKV
jgi:hypothetical protein